MRPTWRPGRASGRKLQLEADQAASNCAHQDGQGQVVSVVTPVAHEHDEATSYGPSPSGVKLLNWQFDATRVEYSSRRSAVAAANGGDCDGLTLLERTWRGQA